MTERIGNVSRLGKSAAFALAMAMLLGGVPVHRVAEAQQPRSAKPLVVFTSHRLANGLPVVLAPDHAVPVVGVCRLCRRFGG